MCTHTCGRSYIQVAAAEGMQHVLYDIGGAAGVPALQSDLHRQLVVLGDLSWAGRASEPVGLHLAGLLTEMAVSLDIGADKILGQGWFAEVRRVQTLPKLAETD